jgi:hypothetical protein
MHFVGFDRYRRVHLPELHFNVVQVHALLGADADAFLLVSLETWLRNPDAVVARHQVGENEASVCIADERADLPRKVAGQLNIGSRDDRTLGINDASRNLTGDGLGMGSRYRHQNHDNNHE